MWIASEYLIAPHVAGLLRSLRNGHSADTQDKARTARLQEEVNCCGANQKRLLLQNTRGGSELLPARCRPSQPSGPRFVLSVRAVSVSPCVETSQLWQSLRSNTLTQCTSPRRRSLTARRSSRAPSIRRCAAGTCRRRRHTLPSS